MLSSRLFVRGSRAGRVLPMESLERACVWFRNDLRVTDNPALNEAVKFNMVLSKRMEDSPPCSSLVQRSNDEALRGAEADVSNAPTRLFGLIVVAPRMWREKFQWGLAKTDYYLRTAVALQAKLATFNISLIVHWYEGEDGLGLGKDIVQLCQKYGWKTIFLNAEYDGVALERDERVKTTLDTAGISHCMAHDQCVVPIGKVLTQSGTPYKVFSQFKRTWVSYIEEHGLQLLADPPVPPPSLPSSLTEDFGEKLYSNSIPKIINVKDRFYYSVKGVEFGEYLQEECDNGLLDFEGIRRAFPAGEDAAQQRLSNFLKNFVQNYHEERNHSSEAGMSRLSAPLAVGSLSLKQCLLAARNVNQGRLLSGEPGIVTWISELCWRDFYRHVLVNFPHVAYGSSFRPEYQDLGWRGWPEKTDQSAEDDFIKWCKGETGVPIVDAAMRQLRREAWIGNRLRMVVAMYLTKDLLIHWRRGEVYFMRNLIDYDYPSNNGGWQWSASTGTDAQPYFRIFNPLLQSEKFDPDGDYIRKYVVELSRLPGTVIHDPYLRLKSGNFSSLNYPKPMVDHKAAKEKVLALFTGANQRGPTSSIIENSQLNEKGNSKTRSGGQVKKNKSTFGIPKVGKYQSSSKLMGGGGDLEGETSKTQTTLKFPTSTNKRSHDPTDQ